MILAVQSQKQCWVWQIPSGFTEFVCLFVQAHSLLPLCPFVYNKKKVKTSTSTIFTLMGYINKHNSTMHISKNTKSTIFISNLQFISTNLHLNQVFSLQSTTFKSLKSDIQSTKFLSVCLSIIYKEKLAKSTVYI